MLRLLAKTLKVLNSETDPGQISLALVFAMVMGFTPFWSLHNIVVLFLVLLLRANLSSFIVGVAFFSSLAYLLDPLFHRTGLWLLTADPLVGLWTFLYNTLPGRLDRINNTVVTGSLAVSLALAIPAFLVFNMLIKKYRERVLAWVEKSHIVQALKANRFYRIYQSVSAWGGGR
ncbi:MAG: TIGR03546 family protein [Pseudomonadota bacterium]|jgi:uncharacterized protein (TIGR03546 family)